MSTTTAPADAPALAPATLDKYKAASNIIEAALKQIIPLCTVDAVILDICKAGDKAAEAEAEKVYNTKPKAGEKKITKGLAYPTCLSVNGVIANFSPLPTDTENANLKLKENDLVKITLGAHIDGYASVGGESIIVRASNDKPLEDDVKADLVTAAYQAAEAALRSAKAGSKNWEITSGIARVLDEYKDGKFKVKGVESAVTNAASFGWRMQKDDIQAKKTITPFPSSEQRRDSDNSHTLEEGEVYQLTVAVTNADEPKARDSQSHTTSVYCRLPATYILKMKSSREVYSEIVKKAGAFPFPLRILENETRAKLAVRECVQHGLLKPFDVQTLVTPHDMDFVASFTITFALTKNGVVRLTPAPIWYSPEKVKASVEIKDPETKTLITKSLKPSKKKADKKTADAPKA